jgi:hypothetical protein
MDTQLQQRLQWEDGDGWRMTENYYV